MMETSTINTGRPRLFSRDVNPIIINKNKENKQEYFDIFDFLSKCAPIKCNGKYKSSIFEEPCFFGKAHFLGDLFHRLNHLEKTYYINTHQLIPYNYFENNEIQTKDILLSRVKKNGKELKYIMNQTLDICKEAIKQNVYAFDFVSPDLQLYPLYKIIEKKNPIYFNLLLKRQNITMEDLKLQYYCFDDYYILNKDMWIIIISYV
jgi:hypothetical protein